LASKRQKRLVGAAGIEPATLGLEIRCSIRLSYAPSNCLQRSINLDGLDEAQKEHYVRIGRDATC
jgi:hypothetical protein